MLSSKIFPGEIPVAQHICMLYGSEKKRIDVLAQCIDSALQKKEKVLYIGSDNPLISRSLSPPGRTRFKECLGNGQLEVWDPGVTDLRLEELPVFLMMATEEALTAGWSALFFTLDIRDFLKKGFDSFEIMKFESRLNYVCKVGRCHSLCQYDYQRLPASLVRNAIATHSMIAVGKILLENPFFLVPQPKQDSHEFVLDGFVTEIFANMDTMHLGILN
jgi:hypothetical protein